MKKRMLQKAKQALTLLGAKMSGARLHQIQMILNYMRIGRWYKKNDFHVERRLPNRTAVFEAVAERVRDRRVAYLEFGVFQGASMRFWSKNLTHPETRLHGFDSFEGLPEDFDMDGPYMKGKFDVKGAFPQIDDPRVQFFKGWFEDTLPTYQVPDHDVLVLTLDADLYSSTQYVLRRLRAYIKPGTFIYMDDMSRPEHEAKVFQEFIEETGLRFKLVAADISLNRAFFECVAD